MRTSRLVLSAAAAAALTLGLAAPASADHLAEVESMTTKHSTCYIGPNASGLGVAVTGRLQNVQRRDGQVTGFKCLIKDFPKRVTPQESDFRVDFTLTRAGYETDVICSLDETDGNLIMGVLRVNGRGVGHLDCRPGAV